MSVIKMSVIKSALPAYFARDAVADLSALTDKNQRYAPLCATLAGYCTERAQSGNAAGFAKFDAAAQGLKGINGPKVRALASFVAGVKPAHLKSENMQDYADYAEQCEVQLLALVAPKESKPRGPTTDWKALCAQLTQERDALRVELVAAQVALKASKKPVTAPAPVTV